MYYPGVFMGFGWFGIVFLIVFFGILVLAVFMIGRSVGEWSYNNRQPALMAEAVVVSKRQHVGSHAGTGNMAMAHSHTTYYATFQFHNGERMELRLPGPAFGQLSEGDSGTLHYQGRRFLGFDRDYPDALAR